MASTVQVFQSWQNCRKCVEKAVKTNAENIIKLVEMFEANPKTLCLNADKIVDGKGRCGARGK
eukprot:scaffold441028_cov18-Prasinocladus_malaysianus.AAC.1